MALLAPVEDGKIVETQSQNSLKNTSKSKNGMDKDAFLQLLVAQMKYQDPMEPTSNTEYIAQYAQFSQVEQIQNMAASMDLQRASQLVGQQVYIKTVNSQGETNYVRGKVDYVVYENNKAMLSINEQLYSIDDLDTVVDKEYLAAYDKAEEFIKNLRKLPVVNGVDYTDLEAIDKLEQTYNDMSDYEKSFVAKDIVKELNAYIERAKEVRLAIEEAEALRKAQEAEALKQAQEAAAGSEAAGTGAAGAGAAEGAENTEAAAGAGGASEETAGTGEAAGGDKTEETENVDAAEKTAGAGTAEESEDAGESAGTEETETLEA